jgi:hypothetical protein
MGSLHTGACPQTVIANPDSQVPAPDLSRDCGYHSASAIA